MFQTFTTASTPEQGPPRLSHLRVAMAIAGVDALIVPREDRYMGEYVAPADERLAWLTGFTGSAGFCVVTEGEAALFVDGRYRVQGRAQVAADFDIVHWPETELSDWLKQHVVRGTVGFDPWLHTVSSIAALRKAVAGTGLEIEAAGELIDPLWIDRPAPPTGRIFAHPMEFAGESAAAKRARLAQSLRTSGALSAIVTQPDSLAWLLNIRGSDIAHNPVPQGYGVLHDDGRVDLFVRPGKAADVIDHLGPDVMIRDISDVPAALAALSGPVQIDPEKAPEAVRLILAKAGIETREAKDPCALPKARKNAVELTGMREAHLRDGAAMVRFLAWLDEKAPQGGLTEIAVVRALEEFRSETNALRDISFETICGAGSDGAIVHYRVTEASDRPVKPGELLLVDSGGQYQDGTTDITRTIAVGAAPEDAVDSYTAVLRGVIAISRARFPKGVAGRDLDALARQFLWAQGRDYDHGTGHGIGAYLSVHEGPQGISRRNMVPLEAGMIVSNEPGYYRTGAFGIRIENLIAIHAAPSLPGADDRDMLAFETLTFVPFDRRLIDTAVLAPAEKDWIDRYHADTLARIGPRIDGAALSWLTAATAPL